MTAVLCGEIQVDSGEFEGMDVLPGEMSSQDLTHSNMGGAQLWVTTTLNISASV